jgi:hypothetical protein
MGWLENWLHELEPAPRPTAPAIAKPRQPKTEIKTVWFTTRLPRDGDLGAVEAAYYSVVGAVVRMHDQNGKLTGKEQRLGPDDDEKHIASRLAKQARLAATGETDFSGPLPYQNQGYV